MWDNVVARAKTCSSEGHSEYVCTCSSVGDSEYVCTCSSEGHSEYVCLYVYFEENSLGDVYAYVYLHNIQL